jgi:hypothetical protein
MKKEGARICQRLLLTHEKGRNAMTRRAISGTILGACLHLSGIALMPGCGDDGQPARGSISAPRKGGGVQKESRGQFKPTTTRKGKLRS